MTEIRLMLVDDQELVRAGFRMVLDAQADMTVVAEAGNGQEALDLVDRAQPDVVLMDVRMPVMDGVSATKELCARPDGGPKVIVLTTFDLDEYAFTALRAGASGFLLKDAGPQDLLAAVRSVHGGDAVIAPSTTRRLLDQFSLAEAPATPAGPDPRLAVLTAREREVLAAIAQGLNNSEIAATLFMSEATVKTHITHLLAKLDKRDRVHLVLFAFETGMAELRPRS